MRTSTVATAVFCLWTGAAVAGDGLAAPDSNAVWPQWQARITVSTMQLVPVSLLDHGVAQTKAVMGDYYFDTPGLRLPASIGGLRATGGLMSGLRPYLAGYASDALPYLGLGYTGLALKSGWGFTADIGLTLDNGISAARAGRALFGTQGFDGTAHDLRFSPLLQLGVTYAF